VRHCLRRLPSHPHQGTAGTNAHASAVWHVSRSRSTAECVDLPRSRARRTSAGAMCRLPRPISGMRDGLRPSRRLREAGRGDAYDRPGRDQEDPRRGRQVRYRVRELPPSADVSSAHERISSGSSSVGGASAFQAECRGFESRLPLQPPRLELIRPADGQILVPGNSGHDGVAAGHPSCVTASLCMARFSWGRNLAANEAVELA
jgi:hypothetical protein